MNLELEDVNEGDVFIPNETINNLFGNPLFEKDKEYKVISVYQEEIYLNHTLYANEYMGHEIEWLNKNFKRG